MKKIFLALAAIAAIAFVGCSDDDDNNNKSDGLAGTSWTYTESYSLETITETLQFQSGGVVIWSGKVTDSYGTENYFDTGSYIYEEPNVTIRIVIDEDYGTEVYTGKVEGKTLRLHDEYGDSYTFTKK